MITIKDIARAAGVSHTTVSRALNGSPLIKPVTRERIAKIASDMNYVPNYSAKNLVTRKSNTIGLFFSSIEQGTSSSFLADALKGIRRELDEHYMLTMSGIDDPGSLESINPRRYDGILVMSQSELDNRFIYHVQSADIPLVVLNRQLDDPSIANVASDDRVGGRAAADHAFECGHRAIAIIEGKSGFKSSSERRLGYTDSLLSHGISPNPDYFVPGDYSIESGYAAMNALLDLNNRPTAVFCGNDDMAIGAMNACFDRGVHVPGDVSLIGFDDMIFARYTNPPLTTIHKSVSEIAAEGTKLLLQRMEQPHVRPIQRLLGSKLVQRRSVAKFAGSNEHRLGSAAE
ncbi:LacI family DNA-binding transcriptional regulator [Saccharibacillus endophyticus]|uniref:HTH-type transcriptional repressor ExuR n=1 Tax=Saccharibacillus endophyticus TaxID=2060666 RepID=A0ABQ1ZLS8_9BACL|nr:LacI family DNA-binding transcriptional regulator [Saccharibacillus endophyticus]GGH70994.1 putative HTH-type transcriptional repressor ExuR [Saccharibacillus endophyticus]